MTSTGCSVNLDVIHFQTNPCVEFEFQVHDINKQTETFLTGEELLAFYAGGRRDFSDLCFETYLDLDDSDLRNIDFTNCWLDASFKNTNLENAVFTDSCIKTACFHNANLAGADFRGAAIDATEFDNAKMFDANFENATAHSHTFGKGELPT